MKRAPNNYNLPEQVNALNGLLHYPPDPKDHPQFQLDPTSKIILLDNVTFGPGVTIAAGKNARISIEASHLHHCTIAAHEHTSIYIRQCYINEANIKASVPSGEQTKRMLLEYLRLTNNTSIWNCPLISGKRYGDNRIFHLSNCHLTGKVTLKGHGTLTGANITVMPAGEITLQHGYADRNLNKPNKLNKTDPLITPEKSAPTSALLSDLSTLGDASGHPIKPKLASVDLDPLAGILEAFP